MKIVVLDGYALNPGDLTWQSLEALGSVKVYDRTAASEVVERSLEADAILVNKTVLTKEALESLPNLRYIGVMATGYNNVDIQTAKSRRIIVSNVAGYSTQSVAQLTFAFLLALSNRVEAHSESVMGRGWSRSLDFSYSLTPQKEIHGKTLGLIGQGSIGSVVAKIGQAFGMKILIHRRNVPKEIPSDLEYVSLDEIFRRSDFLSLHTPLTSETEHLVNAGTLALMKKSAFLINTSRGPLIEEASLAKALIEGEIAGAGLDVLSSEPPNESNPLLKAPNCIITPHIAWATFESRERLMELVSANLKAFIEGKTQNVVG